MFKVKPGKRRSIGMGKRSPIKGKSPHKRRSMSKIQAEADLGQDSDNGAAANIRVAVRVRPENEREINSNHRNIIDVVGDRMLVFDPKEERDDFFFHGQKQQRRDLNKKANRDQKFAFDVVFGPESTNEDVYNGTTKDIVDVVFKGYNCSVFVYGATGAGKTHTMLGAGDENPGIIFRTVKELYDRIETLSEESDCEIVVSYLEVYNETVIDLINPGTILQIREDGKMGVNIPGLSRHRPSGPEDLLKLLQYGNSNRTQHPTDANKESSRSHAVFQVFVKQTGKDSGLSADVKVAKLSMIDLAGSERGSATSSRGQARFREGANINKSLLALGNCINALADGSKYIPYRNSKLTRLLKDSIGGNCRTVMISNISPSSLTYEDTFNTLRYADRAKKIKIKLKKNIMSVDFQVGQYAKIVEDLKSQLNEYKVKISALEEENSALKNQLEDEDQQRGSGVKNCEELEVLKAQLAELEERQRDYDDLQNRLKEFEAKERLEKLEEKVEVQFGEEVLEYLDTLKKSQDLEATIRQLIIKKNNFKSSLERGKLFNPDADFDYTNSKAYKNIKSLDAKVARLKKKEKNLLETLETFDVPHDNADFKAKVDAVKHENQLSHALKVTEIMFHEQSQTEELLQESLKQLKSLYLVNFETSSPSSETCKDFKNLLAKVQNRTIQFRDYAMTETNLDEKFDQIGNFYGNIVNLDAELQTEETPENMNETVVIDKNNELILTFVNENNDEEDEEEIEEEKVFEIRPPTPPKASPTVEIPAQTQNITEPRRSLFKPVEEDSSPSPPKLKTIESKTLFKPVQDDFNNTFDFKDSTVNSTIVLSQAEDFNSSTVEETNVNSTIVISRDEETNVNSTIVISKEEENPVNSTIVISQSEERNSFNPELEDPQESAVNSTVVLSQSDETDVNSTVVLSKAEDELSLVLEDSRENSPMIKQREDESPRVAKVLPMVPEKSKLTSSAPTVDRRNPMNRRPQNGPLMRRQTGVKSTSNLMIKAVERLHQQHLPKGSLEAPEPRTPSDLNLPSYLKPTTASSNKFKSGLTPSRSPTHSNENLGKRAPLSKNPQRMRKDISSTTLKPINK